MALIKIPLLDGMLTDVEPTFEGFRIIDRIPAAMIRFFAVDNENSVRRLEYLVLEIVLHDGVEPFVRLVDELQAAIPEMRRMAERLERGKIRKQQEAACRKD